MSRFRWFRAEWPISIRTLANRLKGRPYNKDVFDGFLVDRVRDDALQARFIERLHYTETITDPFGLITQTERVEYRQYSFAAHASFPELETVDLPRNANTFSTRLAEVNQFAVAVSGLSVDVLEWASLIQGKLGVKGVVNFIQISNLALDKDVRATVQMRGADDVRPALTTLAKNRRYSLERLQLRLADENRTTLLLTSSGTARCESDGDDELRRTLRAALIQAAIS